MRKRKYQQRTIPSEYALYQGDEFITLGTMKEISEFLNRSQ